MPKSSDTAAILRQLADKKAHRKCFVLNERRQLYVLEVVRWEPETCTVVATKPKGRQGKPDSADRWQVTVRTFEGAFAFEVTNIKENGQELNLVLDKACHFAARRSKVRLQAESRNPVTVVFRLTPEGPKQSAELIDFSREGLGLDWSSGPRIEKGTMLYAGQFRVCSEEVSFDRAEVIHAQDTGEDCQRIGVRFTRVTGKQAAAIKTAFDTCFLMQPYVSSTALDS
jgi:c-di-GMP-binding flagellar brake protein YcgR